MIEDGLYHEEPRQHVTILTQEPHPRRAPACIGAARAPHGRQLDAAVPLCAASAGHLHRQRDARTSALFSSCITPVHLE